jgi:hypothetical protein
MHIIWLKFVLFFRILKICFLLYFNVSMYLSINFPVFKGVKSVHLTLCENENELFKDTFRIAQYTLHFGI